MIEEHVLAGKHFSFFLFFSFAYKDFVCSNTADIIISLSYNNFQT